MISSPCSTSTAGNKKPKTALRSPPPESKWKTSSQQLIYGRRLFTALRSARSGADPPSISSREIKNAADSALALTAQAKTRWSRAILFGCCSRRKVLLKAAGKNKIRRRRPARRFAKHTSPEQTPILKDKKVSDRLRLLSRIVPGCRKLSPPCVLEEAADYVAALEMQVKTMRALADALCASSMALPARGSGSIAAGDCEGSES